MSDKIIIMDTVQTMTGKEGKIVGFETGNAGERLAKVMFSPDIFHIHGTSCWYPLDSLTKINN